MDSNWSRCSVGMAYRVQIYLGSRGAEIEPVCDFALASALVDLFVTLLPEHRLHSYGPARKLSQHFSEMTTSNSFQA
jgi:hypothetical protein